MLDQSSETFKVIGSAMAQTATGDWQRVRLIITAAGMLMETSVVVDMADGTTDLSHVLNDETHQACGQLRGELAQLGTGAWYNATLTLERSTMTIDADFDYDERPFEGSVTDEMLLEDQDVYPRDQENLPDWHPAKATT